MRVVAFEPREHDATRVLEFIPSIDGALLTDLVTGFERARGYESRPHPYGGLIPAHYRFGSARDHYLGQHDGKTPLLGCECGEWGCWPLLARIVLTGDRVRWCDFEQPFRAERDYGDFGPFEFDAEAYAKALDEIGEPWATVPAA